MSTTLDSYVSDPSEVPSSFYVTVKDGDRTGFLLGPYDTHEAAKRRIARARRLSEKADFFACFYGFGVARAPEHVVIDTVFGA